MQEQNMQMPRVFCAKARAEALLATRENRITLILGLLILMLQIPLYLALQSACELICERCLPMGDILFSVLVNGVYGGLLALGVMLVTLPSILGFLGMAARIADGKSATVGDMLGVYASTERYTEALSLSVNHFYPLCVALLCAVLTKPLFLLIGTEAWVTRLATAAVILELAVGFVVWSARFPMTAHTNLFFSHGERLSGTLLRRDAMRCGLRFAVSFLPSILLGILTLGIYLLWETLPKMALAYFCYVGQLDFPDAADDYE